MGDLPEVPFEKVLSYLSLQELIRSRAVSRLWRDRIDIYRMRSLCYSDRPRGFIHGNGQWIRGAFDQYFINSSAGFASFFKTFGSTTFSGLKRLRLCDVHLSAEEGMALPETLASFRHLESLDIIRLNCSSAANPESQFQLNLPMLKSIRLDGVDGIGQLTVNAPRLKQVRLEHCPRVSIVHVESVEKLIIGESTTTAIEQLKNLKNLHVLTFAEVDPTLLSGLDQLKELHLVFENNLRDLFRQKRRYSRADLKIYLAGCLLDEPSDPLISSLIYFNSNYLVSLASNPSRLADEIPFQLLLDYPLIERVAPELAPNILKRFIDLKLIAVNEPIQDLQRFLNFLRSFDNIVELRVKGDQPQELFDQLPEPSAIRKLEIKCEVSDFRFLFNLKNLMYLYVNSIDFESIQRVLEELKFLSKFHFKYSGMFVEIVINHPIGHPKRFLISIDENDKWKCTSDLTAAIRFIQLAASAEEE